MQKKIQLKLKPSEIVDAAIMRQRILEESGIETGELTAYEITRKSIDARQKKVYYTLSINLFINEAPNSIDRTGFELKPVSKSAKRVCIIGAGPAGLFAALKLIEAGVKPIIIERGKNVRDRRRDLATLNKEGIINPESNYCFGEGGAGTYSDGKLYTRSIKRGRIENVLQAFVDFGAGEQILYEAHPHIGTNKLPQIITAMREAITANGGEVIFEKKLTGFEYTSDTIKAIKTADGDMIAADAFVLATGHSARDVFKLMVKYGIPVSAKPFALGVRIEHPQELIDSAQYHCTIRDLNLPPASYSLVTQVKNRGVFSFCMCPGGIIAPASTDHGELVVNGWSPSKRNNPFANSGMVVQVEIDEVLKFLRTKEIDDPFVFMRFQQLVEKKCFDAGGGKFVAPAQAVSDFINRKKSASLPNCSYLPGIVSADLYEVLPDFIAGRLREGIKEFGKKIKGYISNDAVLVATESRTSSPVRIERNADTLESSKFHNLYPCGEGAGYAGGIVSAAMDGIKVAAMVANKIKQGAWHY